MITNKSIFVISFFQILALTVRYLTRRYIGEYRSKTDLLYRQTISLDSGLLDVEIVDVSADTDNEFPIEQIQWADSCLIVYSITDRESFKYATRALGNLKSLQNGPSAYLIANKADLDHLREVSISLIPTCHFEILKLIHKAWKSSDSRMSCSYFVSFRIY